MIYISFNVSANDFSGLPTYSEMFLRAFSDIKKTVVNIIADPNGEYGYEHKVIDGYTDWYDCYLPAFLSGYDVDFQRFLKSLMDEYSGARKIIVPDYLLEQYLEYIPVRKMGYEKILFIHLLYRGMMDVFMKQPYFEQHLQTSMTYMGRVSWLEWKAVMTSDRIICNSSYTYRQLLKYYEDCGLQYKPQHILPLGVYKNEIPYMPANDSNKWAYFGRLDTQKGVWYILKDVALNTNDYKNNPPIICGDGQIEGPFLKGDFFDNTFKFKGNLPKDELYQALQDVKYCIFPSIYEPWSLALTEAMAMGKICIISDVDSGMREQVTPGKDAIVFDFAKNSIVKMIQTLNNVKKHDYNNMSHNARENAKDISEHFYKLRGILDVG